MKFDGPTLNRRWQLGPAMGSGSQASTYLARDARSKRKRVVIVKQLRLVKSGGSWKNFDLFEREVRVLKSLVHPGIPRFIEHFESEPGVFNLVMERMPGATLRSFAKKVVFTDDELLDVLAKLLEVLDYLHGLDPPVVHRDIKPANILRDQSGKISLVDFGGVREVFGDQGGSTVIGTFGYMAPEQLHGQATPATDIYGLGATLVALAGGEEPEHVARKGLRMDLENHLRGHDPTLIELLGKMTAPDPDDRPQTARAVADLIAALRSKRRDRARHAAALVAPGEQAHGEHGEQALTVRGEDKPRPFDEVSDMLAEVPAPLRLFLRVVLVTFSITGWVGVVLLKSVMLPLVFSIVGALSSDASRPKIGKVRGEIEHALDEGAAGLRNLQRRSLRQPGKHRSRRERRRERRALREERRRKQLEE